jgi:hypothetical protein
METRTCTVCHCELPANLEYFYSCPVVRSGLSSRCKSCSKQYDIDHKEQAQKWREENREIIREKKHANYLKNKERINQKNYEYYLTHKQQLAKAGVMWKKNNPEKMRVISHRRYERVKDHHKILTRQWKQTHKEERNIAWQARRAKKLSLDYTLLPEQWEQIKTYFDNKCCYCGKKLKLTQDHFVPLLNNGEYTHNNIVPCCLSCNSSKNEKNFFDWYPKYEYYSKTRERKILKFLGYKDGVQQLELVDCKLYNHQMNEQNMLTYY